MYTFPTTIDEYERIVSILGSYWPIAYGGADTVIGYAQGTNAAEQQLFQNLLEVQASVDRHTCPVFNTQLWYSLTINKSDEKVNGLEYSYPIPAALRQAHYAADGITNPATMFVRGIDFQLDTTNNVVIFTHSLFANTSATTITLWFWRAGLDNNWVYEQVGYIIPLQLTSSYEYRSAANAILDAYASATSYDNVAQLLEAIADAPRVRNDGEVIEVITKDASSVLVITDQNVYRFGINAMPIVSVGQVMHEGDQLTDAVTIFEPSVGTVPSISSLTLGAGFLDPSIAGPLTFNNTNTALNVTLNVSGFTKVDWALGGAGGDVTNFFNILHTKGIAAGKTLAMCMDTRPQPQVTQPTAFNLPTVINPMLFLYQNVLRANAFTILLKTASFGPNALGTGLLPLLRSIVPPHSAAITVVS